MRSNELYQMIEKNKFMTLEQIKKAMGISQATFYNYRRSLKREGIVIGYRDNKYYIEGVTNKSVKKVTTTKAQITSSMILDTICKNNFEASRNYLKTSSSLKQRIGERALDKHLKFLEEEGKLKSIKKGREILYKVTESYKKQIRFVSISDISEYKKYIDIFLKIFNDDNLEVILNRISSKLQLTVDERNIRIIDNNTGSKYNPDTIQQIKKIESESVLCKITLNNGANVKGVMIYMYYDFKTDSIYELIIRNIKSYTYEIINIDKIKQIKKIKDVKINHKKKEDIIADLTIKGTNCFEEVKVKLIFYKYYNNFEIVKRKLKDYGRFSKLSKNELIFEGSVYGLNRIYGFLKELGGNVKVIEPEILREKLLENYIKINKIYED